MEFSTIGFQLLKESRGFSEKNCLKIGSKWHSKETECQRHNKSPKVLGYKTKSWSCVHFWRNTLNIAFQYSLDCDFSLPGFSAVEFSFSGGLD